jgi:hypothetical protein
MAKVSGSITCVLIAFALSASGCAGSFTAVRDPEAADVIRALRRRAMTGSVGP